VVAEAGMKLIVLMLFASQEVSFLMMAGAGMKLTLLMFLA